MTSQIGLVAGGAQEPTTVQAQRAEPEEPTVDVAKTGRSSSRLWANYFVDCGCNASQSNRTTEPSSRGA
jgi:hypothetical protein